MCSSTITPLRHHQDHGQAVYPRLDLEKAKALGAKTVLETWLAAHLHLQQHHRLLQRAGLPASGPKRPIKPVACGFEFRRLKAIERIPRRIRPELRHRRGTLRQQQGDQIRRALEQPVEPVIGFQGPPTHTKQPPSTTQTPLANPLAPPAAQPGSSSSSRGSSRWICSNHRRATPGGWQPIGAAAGPA